MAYALRDKGIAVLRKFFCAQIEYLEVEVLVKNEDVFLILKYRSSKRKFAKEFNFVCLSIDRGRSVEGSYINVIFPEWVNIGDEVSEEIIISVLSLECVYLMTIPDIQSVCSTQIYVPKVVLIHAEDCAV